MYVTFLCNLSQQEAILEDLRTDIPVHFNFLFSDSHVEVISGKQEGEKLIYEAFSSDDLYKSLPLGRSFIFHTHHYFV